MSKSDMIRIKNQELWLQRVKEEQAYADKYVGDYKLELNELQQKLWDARVAAWESRDFETCYKPGSWQLYLSSVIQEPFRVHLFLKEDGSAKSVHVGKHDVFLNGEIVIYSWNSIYGEIVMNSRLKREGVTRKGLKYSINRFREIIFGSNAVVHDVKELDFVDKFTNVAQANFAQKIEQDIKNRGDQLRYDNFDEKLIKELDIDELRASRLRQSNRNLNQIFWTISYTQSEIVRAEMDRPIIIQGGAGSGKSSVGMHRLAFLMYNNRIKNAEALGPSSSFSFYIKGMLKDLGVKNPERIVCRTKKDFFGDVYKTLSNNFYKKINSYSERYFKTPVYYGAETLLSSNEEESPVLDYINDEADRCLREMFRRLNVLYKNFCNALGLKSISINNLQEVFAGFAEILEKLDTVNIKWNELKSEKRDLVKKLTELVNRVNQRSFIEKVFSSRTNDHLEIARLQQQISSINSKIKHQGEILKSIFGPDNVNWIMDLDSSTIRKRVVDNVLLMVKDLFPESILKKTIKSEALSSDLICILINLYLKIDECLIEEHDFRKTPADFYFIDKGQDLSLLEFKILKELVGDRILIAGDINQRIFDNKGIDSWEKVKEIFNAQICELKYNWRSTIPIVAAAQPYKVDNKYDNLGVVEGELPQYFKIHNNNLKQILKQLIIRLDEELPSEKTAALIFQNKDQLDYYSEKIIELGKEKKKGLKREPLEKVTIRKSSEENNDLDLYIYRGANRIPPGIIVTCIDYVKGFEFYSVATVRHKRPDEMDANEKVRMYTTITRATDKLYIIDET